MLHTRSNRRLVVLHQCPLSEAEYQTADLQICILYHSTTTTRYPAACQPDSNLGRLLNLAQEIFQGVCPPTALHPARDYRDIVQKATSLILTREPISNTGQSLGVDPSLGMGIDSGDDATGLQGLFDLMSGSGMDWSGTFLAGE